MEIKDSELETSFHHWLDHYIKNGEKHYSDAKEDRIIELYWDNIVDRVLQDLPEMSDEENENIVERLSNMF